MTNPWRISPRRFLAFGNIRLAGLLLPLLLLLPGSVTAAGGEPAAAEVPRLPVVEVVAAPAAEETVAPEDHATGKSVLDAKTTTALPLRDATINDLLTILPGIQAGETAHSSLTGGEILPPLISIAGGKLEQNNFRIDGLGNNSLLDPLFDSPNNPTDVPGNPQEIFLNAHLVESVTVYDHNVPARFGGFTGGVVDATTRDPRSVPGGSLRYRTTRDEWTSFHLAPADQADFAHPTSDTKQPHFHKQEGGAEFDLPFGPTTGLLAAIAVNYAKIPLSLLESERDESRRSDNYLLKLVHYPSASEKVTLEGLYSPYREYRFIKNSQGSGFSLDGSSGRLGLGYLRTDPAGGELELHGGVRLSENSRQAPTDSFTWKVTPGKPWGAVVGSTSSLEGGFGDLSKKQRTLETSGDWHSAWMPIGDWHHQFSAGVGGERTTAWYDRPQTSYAFKGAQLDAAVVCQVGDPACVDGEQWLTSRVVYRAAKVTVSLTQAYLYLEDRQQLGRLELRPGVRLSYDDFMNNTNLAPRFAASYDLAGNGKTVLVGGWNRYYGQTLLTYKLREAISPTETESRTTADPGAWTTKAPVFPSQSQYSSLDTPYNDEIVAGLDQALFGGTGKLRYIRRDGHDEFAREIDPVDLTQREQIRYARLNNHGRSHHHEFRFDWRRLWARQALDLNVTFQKTTTTNNSYDDTLELEDLSQLVWYDGRLLAPDELPRTDFNRQWSANLTYIVELPWHLRFSNITRYRSGYRSLRKTTGEATVDGVDYPVYAEFKSSSATTFDWRLDWLSPPVSGQTLRLTLEIYNVFDRSNHVVDANNPTAEEYALGRQFWAGAEYAF
jgi:hypothetical protein